MSQIEHDTECTPVKDATMSVLKTAARYALRVSSFFLRSTYM